MDTPTAPRSRLELAREAVIHAAVRESEARRRIGQPREQATELQRAVDAAVDEMREAQL